MNKYRQDKNSCKDTSLTNQIDALLTQHAELITIDYAGLKQCSEPKDFDLDSVEYFFQSRNSVRVYSDEPITDEEITRACSFATCTPTACNRQSSSVYAFTDKDMIEKILDNQLGDQGWCRNATALFVVTGKLTFFEGIYERQQVYVDGGLFAMNFVYGLHLQHIATCYKMFVREPKRENQFKTICGIPDNETPVVLILAGHYTDTPVECPKSHRFAVPLYINKRR